MSFVNTVPAIKISLTPNLVTKFLVFGSAYFRYVPVFMQEEHVLVILVTGIYARGVLLILVTGIHARRVERLHSRRRVPVSLVDWSLQHL